MAQAIDFYFDFSSPYGYLASVKIDAIAARFGRQVTWRPILLGPAFKLSGNAPLIGQPLKGDYAIRDFVRTAKFMQIPFHLPAVFPISTVAAARAYYHLQDQNPSLAKDIAKALFHRYFAEGVDISSIDAVTHVAAQHGVDAALLGAALADTAVKERLKAEVEKSLSQGVFGSPYIVIDGEAFWGSDRLDQIEIWLDHGPW